MNDILSLKGNFEQKANTSTPGSPKLPKNTKIDASDIKNLIAYLENMETFWMEQKILTGALISVYYNKIVAKSNRIQGYLAERSKNPNLSIVGAKFSSDKTKHIITHYISRETLKESITHAKAAVSVLENEFSGHVTTEIFNKKASFLHIDFSKYKISKSKFQKIIVDTAYVDKFDVEYGDYESYSNSIVTLYETDNDPQKLLQKLDIKITNNRILNKNTILLDPQYLQILLQKAPFLIAMAVENISELSYNDFEGSYYNSNTELIPSPKNEPTIGVIDTLFDENVYFSSWVKYQKMIDEEIPTDFKDFNHGTAVTSIIVDGPRLNPKLDDGCGRFRVKHFGVATSKAFNSFSIIRSIKEIVASNPEIRVWNLSLGSNDEIKENFISAEAAVLDQIQFENDVIFVIAGTNSNAEKTKRIGAPADSINSIIVNSVDFNNKSATYTRKGIVLSFFTKPDVSYYGGGNGDFINVVEPLGEARVAGTSYAAPWISRKLSYLIDIIGLSKEVAKALLIDSAIGWDKEVDFNQLALIGNGIVPIKIEDIIKSKDDEIRFVVEGTSEKYDTYNYSFPVPLYQEKHPFVAKATLCYFPKCERNQGVDYTNTELDIYFGRINNGKLKSINNNKQSVDDENHYLYEENARKLFRKWDNIKHISEPFSTRTRAKKAYENPLWGMSIKTKERLNANDGVGIKFGVVVTLKEINGINRIEDFIQQCSLKGWLVNRINVNNRIDIYQTADQEIDLE